MEQCFGGAVWRAVIEVPLFLTTMHYVNDLMAVEQTALSVPGHYNGVVR